jgi:diguanylate cyclase (GGDEF)-like protein
MDPQRTTTRAGDGLAQEPAAVRLLARAPAWVRRGGDAPAAGRMLLLFSAVVMLAGGEILGADGRERLILLGTAGALLATTVASLLHPWRRRPGTMVGYPLVVLVVLGVLARTTTGIAQAFVGVIPLCFVYAGLFHRGRVTLLLVPVAWSAYLAVLPEFDAGAWIRLGVYGVTWWAIAQTLAVATAHQRALRDRLRRDARTDRLTSLANRRDLEERLARAQPGDAVVIADLDHFKAVNDTLGHVAGDGVLERFGHLLSQHLRRRDYAARYGGEEFVLILPRTEPVQALNMLRALRAEWAEEGLGITFSGGIAAVTADTPPASALAAADVALYRAKQAGRDRFRIAATRLARPARPDERGDERPDPPAHGVPHHRTAAR